MKTLVRSVLIGSYTMLLLCMVATGALAQFDDPKLCVACHTGVSPVETAEWKASLHAISLEILMADADPGDHCLRCMSAEYRMASEDAKPTLETVTESISCAACHEHDTGLENNLVVSAAENCMQCHTMGTSAPGRTPHHPQREVFLGVGAAGIAETPSPHIDLEGTCVACHMYKEGEEVVTEGGHTLHASVEACNSCHTDAEATMEAIQTDVANLLDGLTVLLDAVPEEDRVTDSYKEALFNVKVVEVDKSHGIHNYPYARAALEYAYTALGAAIPVSLAATCTNCHATDTEYTEWEDSLHADSLEILMADADPGNNCLRCMSSEYRVAPEDAKPTLETVTESISCAACHEHGTGLEHNLVVSAAENCMQCHTMGSSAPGRTPHHPQREAFLGVRAAGVADMPSPHTEIEGTCVACHMYKEGEGVATEGGHTLHANVEACAECHADTGSEAMVAAMHDDVGGLLAGLAPLLEAVPEEERETDAYKEALFNVKVFEVDKSGGVHNYAYAKAALGYSYGALGAVAPIVYNCEICHAGSVQYAEWEHTAHALSLVNNPPSGDNCLRCKAASDVKQNPAVTLEEVTLGIACNACHSHGSVNEHNLIVSAAENCVECHTMGTAAPGRSPHHPQGEMFAGIGGAGVSDMESGHSKTMPDKCVACHMYKAGEEVATEGGHTFHANLESCAGCHTDGATLMVEAQAKVTILLEDLGAALEAVPEEERETAEYLEALFNKDMVEVDKSLGVHNTDYAVALLSHAYSALGVEMPDVGGGAVEPQTGEFTVSLTDGLNMISLPLNPATPYTARSLAAKLGATVVIMLDSENGRFVGFTPEHDKGDGFPIEGAMGYIVNLPAAMDVTFEGTMWSNAVAAPAKSTTGAWAFLMTGLVHNVKYELAAPGMYLASVTNLRTGASATDMVGVSSDGRYTVAWADLSRKSVVEIGDRIEITIRDSAGQIVSGPAIHQVAADDIERAFGANMMELGNITPEKSMLAQNYPNPFNPETWIPYQLAEDSDVMIRIYNASGRLVRVLDLNQKNAGTYMSKQSAAYWNGRDDNGELVASGVYVYSIQAGAFTAVRKMVILK